MAAAILDFRMELYAAANERIYDPKYTTINKETLVEWTDLVNSTFL